MLDVLVQSRLQFPMLTASSFAREAGVCVDGQIRVRDGSVEICKDGEWVTGPVEEPDTYTPPPDEAPGPVGLV